MGGGRKPRRRRAGTGGGRIPTRRTTRSHRVRFSSDVDEFPSRIHISDDDISDLWFTKQEYQLMQRSRVFIVRMMASKQVALDDADMCARGLENMTKAGGRRRRENIQTSIDAVLDEQEHQWQQGQVNLGALARVYTQATRHCAMAAYIAGQRDAKEVART